MRNLKKILALALALIMSLSLMVTASAAKTEFGDQEAINENYQLAIEVLNELGVLKGDDRDGDGTNEFRPTDTITRGEVAAIIYRVFTGKIDAANDGHTIYTAAEGEFADVKGHWSEGYMVYAFQGGYIKGWPGVGGINLNPGGNITGYEVLTMILRAVGYDKKENEFTGLNWKLNVSTTATTLGVLANYQGADLGAAATRQEVAELIFRAILLPKVEYNLVTNSYSAPDANNTIAASPLGLTRIEGIVVANEWASLYDTDVIDDDTTTLRVNGVDRTLNVGTDITDIGESRYAYVQNGTNVLGSLEDTGDNVVKDYRDQTVPGAGVGAATLWGSSVNGAEHYLNFDRGLKDSSEYRLEYSVSFMEQKDLDWFEAKYKITDLPTAAKDENKEYNRSAIDELRQTGGSYTANPTANPHGITFTRTIPAGDKITELDLAIMEGIFKSAGSFDENHQDFGALTAERDNSTIAGYVYAGTRTAPNNLDQVDLSDNGLTYDEFVDEYIGTSNDLTSTTSTYGGWLKIVDNNNDGKVEYVFLTRYNLAEIVDYNERTKLFVYSDDLDTSSSTGLAPKYRDGYTPEVGNFVLWAEIDGQAVIQKVEPQTTVFEKYDWRSEIMTTTDGTEYHQSGTDVTNGTDYEDQLEAATYGVEYYIYLDAFGHIRAYRPVDNNKHYGLLTELYYTGSLNDEYVKTGKATAELWYVDADGTLVGDKEYDVANRTTTPFIGTAMYGRGTELTHRLERAMAHLGLSATSSIYGNWTYSSNPLTKSLVDTAAVSATMTFDFTTNGSSGTTAPRHGMEFDYDDGDGTETNLISDIAGKNQKLKFTYTNVAKYTLNDDGTVDLDTAAEYATKQGAQLYYWDDDAVSTWPDAGTGLNLVIGGTRDTEAGWRAAYMTAAGIESDTGADKTRTDNALKAHLVPVYAEDYVQLENAKVEAGKWRYDVDANYTTNYFAIDNSHVDAVKDTVFFVVTPNYVYSYVGYEDLPDIALSEVHAMYAVAQSATDSTKNGDYWVADVIVIETNTDIVTYTHMILNFNDNYKVGNRAEIHNLDAIDCTTGEVVSVTVNQSWGGARMAPGFYVLNNPEVDENGDIYTTRARKIETLFPTDIVIPNDEYNAVAESNYNKYHIYAGELVRAVEVSKRDNYIEVWKTWSAIAADEASGKDNNVIRVDGAVDVPWYVIHATSSGNLGKGIYTYDILTKSDYKDDKANGHELIWVTDSKDNVLFVVDTTFTSNNIKYLASFLNNDTANGKGVVGNDDAATGIYDAVMDEQEYKGTSSGTGSVKVTITYGGGATVLGGEEKTVTRYFEPGRVAINKTTFPQLFGINGLYDADLTKLSITSSTPATTSGYIATMPKTSTEWVLYDVPAKENIEMSLTVQGSFAVKTYALTIESDDVTGQVTVANSSNSPVTMTNGTATAQVTYNTDISLGFSATTGKLFKAVASDGTVLTVEENGSTGNFTVTGMKMPAKAITVTITEVTNLKLSVVPNKNVKLTTAADGTIAVGTDYSTKFGTGVSLTLENYTSSSGIEVVLKSVKLAGSDVDLKNYFTLDAVSGSGAGNVTSKIKLSAAGAAIGSDKITADITFDIEIVEKTHTVTLNFAPEIADYFTVLTSGATKVGSTTYKFTVKDGAALTIEFKNDGGKTVKDVDATGGTGTFATPAVGSDVYKITWTGVSASETVTVSGEVVTNSIPSSWKQNYNKLGMSVNMNEDGTEAEFKISAEDLQDALDANADVVTSMTGGAGQATPGDGPDADKFLWVGVKVVGPTGTKSVHFDVSVAGNMDGVVSSSGYDNTADGTAYLWFRIASVDAGTATAMVGKAVYTITVQFWDTNGATGKMLDETELTVTVDLT